MADESKVVEWLRDDPTVVSIVGTRIYAEIRAEGDRMPSVCVELIAGTPTNFLNSVPSVDRRLVLVTAFGKNRREARALGVAVRDALEPRGHMLGDGPLAYNDDLKSWDYQLEFSFWLSR